MAFDYLRTLIPKDKFDFSPFPELMAINEEEVQPILLDLLFWIADMNWPIAIEMIKVLARFPDSVTPLIKELLKPTEKDDCWKFSLVLHLVPTLPKKSQEQLVESMKRILDAPTDGEVDCGVWKVAKDYLARVYTRERGTVRDS